MSGVQNFRSAIGGFNRQDVVHYIEYINNKHKTEIEQLNTQLQTAREALEQQKPAVDADDLRKQLEQAQARCAKLEAQLAGQSQQEAPVKTGDELEAYRRAERAERLARERASQIYAQANAALADATVKMEAASDSMSEMTEQFTQQLQQTKQKLQEAVASLYAIRPEEE